MLLAGRDVADDDSRQAALALETDQPVAIGGMGEDEPAVLMRHQVLPVVTAGRFDRRRDDLEVLGVAGVGEDVEDPARLVDVVLLRRTAWRDQLRRRAGRVGRQEVDLGRLVIVTVDDEILVRLRLADGEEVSRVGIFKDDDVLGCIGADGVT